MGFLTLVEIVWLSSSLVSGVYGAEVLRQVQVVTRHGARTVLKKNSNTLQEGGGVSLTPLGERQLYDMGVWLRNRYQDQALLRQYTPDTVRLESSGLERTLVSANSLAMGLFPTDRRQGVSALPVPRYNNIPVYMTKERNDIVLRPYTKCPAFFERLSNLYHSDEWKAQQTNSRDLLSKLGQDPLFQVYANLEGIVPLEEIWNVYDHIHVSKTECNDPVSYACIEDSSLSAAQFSVTEEEWSALQSLSHYAENQKYGLNTAGSLIGGNLLLRILQRMRAKPAERLDFHLYSAHYPTILGLLSAMSIRPFSTEVIPEYGSALIFELWDSDEAGNDPFVRVFMVESTVSGAAQMALVGPCAGQDKCPLTAFADLVGEIGYSSQKEWCQICANTISDACLFSTTDIAQQHQSCDSQSSSLSSFGALFGIFLAGIGCGCIGLAIVLWILHNRRDKTEEDMVDPDNIIDLDGEREIS